MAGEAYFHGRDTARLELDKDGADHLYAAQLLDDQSWIGRTYQNCTFANLSFKNVQIDNCSFVNCVFVSCYFRRSLLKSSRFAACRFLDCDFPRVRIHASDFAYARFDRCFIAFNEIGNALPSEHNLREDLARNLANEANAAGASRDAREFRLVAVRAQQADQWNAFRGTSNWYKTHYKGADKASSQ
jgi:uncharacterized protein YjbI with pentapeptide repeats